jgi:RNA polymerase-binding transcription factor DksA
MEQKEDHMGYEQTDAYPPSPAELRRFRAVLLAKQREILGNVISMESEALHRTHASPLLQPHDLADLSTDNYELENTLGLVGSERGLLAEIERALARIQSGTYGVCEGDGQSIPQARLRAIPWTRYCVRCASLNERRVLYSESGSFDADHKGSTRG